MQTHQPPEIAVDTASGKASTSSPQSFIGSEMPTLQSTVENPTIPFSPSQIMQLQKTIGNQAVAQLMKKRSAIDPLIQLQADPIQRVIKKRSDGEMWKYYSDRDPEKILHDTEREAEEAEKELIANHKAQPYPTYDSDRRPPTMYSYAATLPTNAISNEQGPHVVGYTAVDKAIDTSELELSDIFKDQVRSPEEIKEHLEKQITKPSNRVAAQIDRFIFDYTNTYKHVKKLIQTKSDDKTEVLSYIKYLMNTDPKSSTNWLAKFRNRNYKVPRSKIKRKNENSNILDSKNVDSVSAVKKEGLELWEIRKKLVEKRKAAEIEEVEEVEEIEEELEEVEEVEEELEALEALEGKEEEEEEEEVEKISEKSRPKKKPRK